MNDKRQMPVMAEGFDKRFVTVRLRSAQSIVTMDRCKRESPRPGQAMEERQQRDRVRPTRHRDKKVLTGKEQPMLAHCPNELSEQCRSCGGRGRRLQSRRLNRHITELPAEYAAN